MTCIRDARQKLEGYFVDTQHVAHKLIARSSKSRSLRRLRKSIKNKGKGKILEKKMECLEPKIIQTETYI